MALAAATEAEAAAAAAAAATYRSARQGCSTFGGVQQEQRYGYMRHCATTRARVPGKKGALTKFAVLPWFLSSAGYNESLRISDAVLDRLRYDLPPDQVGITPACQHIVV